MKDFLDIIYKKYNNKDYIGTDPVIYPHKLAGNKEFIAFISSVFAYGKVSLIQRFLDLFFTEYGVDPFKKKNKKSIYYRFQKEDDIYKLYQFLHKIYKDYGSLYNYFIKQSANIEVAYDKFRNEFFDYFDHDVTNGLTFLLPDIMKSAAKRIRMFFRWMVRKDEIDFGLWAGYNKKELKFPLDIHILTYAYKHNIINNKINSRKNVEKITDFFKSIDEDDPVKYDFAITRLGMIYRCKYTKSESCESCEWKKQCFLIDNYKRSYILTMNI
ncbi:TIGR02757 family protein [Deferribacter autotrophicus]|uniref:TIGR02757 family protein n=1 Tax=Deferribacter autotrophicus TaxID=500465 RepID=A0A5A8F0J7_9BACT|nr:TIGR02757 family protein [Deferribacter autotrophicus]KAA0257388.1 TIGR02757 family protein [Deferribacter autotrophicus]